MTSKDQKLICNHSEKSSVMKNPIETQNLQIPSEETPQSFASKFMPRILSTTFVQIYILCVISHVQ